MTMSGRRHHTAEQIVRKLRSADGLLANGVDIAGVARELGVSEQTYYRWRNQCGGLKAEDARRLKELGKENGTLKRLLADAELEKAALKEIARGTSKPGPSPGGRRAPAASAGGVAAVRLPGGRAAPVRATPPAGFDDPSRPGRSAPGLAARIRQGAPPVGSASSAGLRTRCGLDREPQAAATALA